MKNSYIFFSLVFGLCLFSPPAFGIFGWVEKTAKKGGKAIGDTATKGGKVIGDAASDTGKAIGGTAKKGFNETLKQAKKIKDVGDKVSKLGGKVVDIGVKVGNLTVVNLSKAGDVTLKVAGKAGTVVLKTGQTVVNSSGMTLLNAGGMILALSQGDLDAFKDCAGAVDTGIRCSTSTLVDETLKAALPIDNIIKLTGVSIEATSSELALQGRTPKVSIKGSFLGKNFNLKDVQFDLSSPHKFAADLVEELFKLQG